MSWLSSFVNNNRNVLGVIPGASGVINALFPPVAGVPVTPRTAGISASFQAPQQISPQAPTAKPGKQITVSGPSSTDSLGISLKGITHVKRTTTATLGASATPQQVAAAGGGGGTRRQRANALRAAQGLPPLKKRINPLNIKALKRSVRRLKGFHKAAVRVERALHLGRATTHRHVARPATANVRIVER
jgi:hypothetical protein